MGWHWFAGDSQSRPYNFNVVADATGDSKNRPHRIISFEQACTGEPVARPQGLRQNATAIR